jgi:hypothetical protein
MEAIWARYMVLLLSKRQRRQARQAFEDLIVPSAYTGMVEKMLTLKGMKGTPLGVGDLPAFDAAWYASLLSEMPDGRRITREILRARRAIDTDTILAPKSSSPLQLSKVKSISDFSAQVRDPLRRMVSGAPVAVDLAMDDATLIEDFKSWLANARKREPGHAKPIQDGQFKEWARYQVLAAFDLTLWSKVTGHRYTDETIADALWPGSRVDNVERLRKVTRPKLQQIWGESVGALRLWPQLARHRWILHGEA